MTHAQIRKKIAVLQKMLEEPEKEKKPTYRQNLLIRRKEILRKYVPEVYYAFLQTEINSLVSRIFYEVIESEGTYIRCKKIFDVLQANKKHEDLYFEIYENICKCISPYVINLKPYEKPVFHKEEEKKYSETAILKKISEYEYSCSECGKKISCDKEYLKDKGIVRCWNCKARFTNIEEVLLCDEEI